jgi:hypothetical protein
MVATITFAPRRRRDARRRARRRGGSVVEFFALRDGHKKRGCCGDFAPAAPPLVASRRHGRRVQRVAERGERAGAAHVRAALRMRACVRRAKDPCPDTRRRCHALGAAAARPRACRPRATHTHTHTHTHTTRTPAPRARQPLPRPRRLRAPAACRPSTLPLTHPLVRLLASPRPAACAAARRRQRWVAQQQLARLGRRLRCGLAVCSARGLSAAGRPERARARRRAWRRRRGRRGRGRGAGGGEDPPAAGGERAAARRGERRASAFRRNCSGGGRRRPFRCGCRCCAWRARWRAARRRRRRSRLLRINGRCRRRRRHVCAVVCARRSQRAHGWRERRGGLAPCRRQGARENSLRGALTEHTQGAMPACTHACAFGWCVS